MSLTIIRPTVKESAQSEVFGRFFEIWPKNSLNIELEIELDYNCGDQLVKILPVIPLAWIFRHILRFVLKITIFVQSKVIGKNGLKKLLICIQKDKKILGWSILICQFHNYQPTLLEILLDWFAIWSSNLHYFTFISPHQLCLSFVNNLS